MEKVIEQLRNVNLEIEQIKAKKEELRKKLEEHRAQITADTVNIERADEYQLAKNGVKKAAEPAAEPKAPASAASEGGENAE